MNKYLEMTKDFIVFEDEKIPIKCDDKIQIGQFNSNSVLIRTGVFSSHNWRWVFPDKIIVPVGHSYFKLKKL